MKDEFLRAVFTIIIFGLAAIGMARYCSEPFVTSRVCQNNDN